jgi:hypothetical protein
MAKKIEEMTMKEITEMVVTLEKKLTQKQTATATTVNGKFQFEVGRAYLFFNVTRYILGKVVANYDDAIVLENSSWVADTGRYHAALANGDLKEVEVNPLNTEHILFKGAICDVAIWNHPLPAKTK